MINPLRHCERSAAIQHRFCKIVLCGLLAMTLVAPAAADLSHYWREDLLKPLMKQGVQPTYYKDHLTLTLPHGPLFHRQTPRFNSILYPILNSVADYMQRMPAAEMVEVISATPRKTAADIRQALAFQQSIAIVNYLENASTRASLIVPVVIGQKWAFDWGPERIVINIYPEVQG